MRGFRIAPNNGRLARGRRNRAGKKKIVPFQIANCIDHRINADHGIRTKALIRRNNYIRWE